MICKYNVIVHQESEAFFSGTYLVLLLWTLYWKIIAWFVWSIATRTSDSLDLEVVKWVCRKSPYLYKVWPANIPMLLSKVNDSVH